MKMSEEYDVIKKSRIVVPDISILIPTYKRSDYLYEAIDSAIRQRSHQCRYEIIVVSNDPDDTLEEMLTRYAMVANLSIYRNKENIGMVGNSNRCAELAKGRYIAFLHDDDLLLPNYLQVFDRYVLHTDKKCAVTGRYIFFEKEDGVYRKYLVRDILRKLYFVPSLFRKKVKRLTVKDVLHTNINLYTSPSCGTIINKDVFEENGGFSEEILYSWDLDFFLRLNLKYPVYLIYEPCGAYRMGLNASMKDDVRWDYHDFYYNRYYNFMKDNHIDDAFLENNENEIRMTVYHTFPDSINRMADEKRLLLPAADNRKWKHFRLKTWLYYYNHNLDIQRLIRKK